MKTSIEYMFGCLMDCLSFNVESTKDFIIGLLQLAIFFVVFTVSTILLTWYYAIAITIGFILALYLCVLIVEFIVRLIRIKIGKKKGKD